MVSAQTILNWHRDLGRAVPRLVRASRPFNALPDLVTHLAHRLKREWPRWGTRRIAGVLARLGLRASRSTVQRMLRRPYRSARVRRAARPGRGRPVVAGVPGDIWVLDFTTLGGLVRRVRVGAVVDACSRKILAIAASATEPTAAFAVRLLRAAIAVHGAAPTYVVTDRGRQFTSVSFRRALARRGITWRLGRLGLAASLPLLERFWRTLKVEFARALFLFRLLRSIDRDLSAFRSWFNECRPHQSLGGRTPDEVHHGEDTRALAVPLRAHLVVERIHGHRDLPVLRLRSAA